MKVLGSLVVNKPWIMKFIESTKIHRYLVIKPHQLWGLVEVPEMLIMINNLDKPFNKFTINVHSILIESIVKIVSKFFILSLAIGWIGKIILIEGMLEDILGFYNKDRTSPLSIMVATHYINIQKLSLFKL